MTITITVRNHSYNPIAIPIAIPIPIPLCLPSLPIFESNVIGVDDIRAQPNWSGSCID
jgi:hypothetical protein